MKNELKLYGQNLLLLAVMSILIGMIGMGMQPQAPQSGPAVLAMLPSSSR